MSSPDRILVPIDPHDKAAWDLALSCAEQLCQQPTNGTSEIILVVPSRPKMKHTTLAAHMGPLQAKALAGGQALQLASGVSLRAEGEGQLRISASRVVLIVYYAVDKGLRTIDDLVNVAGVIAVPSHASAADDWTTRWTPVVPGQAPRVPAVLVTDPKLEKALEALTRTVNKHAETLHPNDVHIIEETFRILRGKSHTAVGSDIGSWAIQHGWKAKAADKLLQIASRILGTKTKPSLSKIANAQARYDNWV